MEGGDQEEQRYTGVPPDKAANFKDVVREFMRGLLEMSVQFGRGCRDVVQQSLVTEDSFLVRNFGKDSCIGRKLNVPYDNVLRRLKVFNEYLVPEDKDPWHAWSVILFVFVLALAVLSVSVEHDTAIPVAKKVYIHPPSADRIMLPDGRYMAYREQGLPADRARFTMIIPHSFLSSRLAGIPGLKASLLEEFGVRLLTYDLPGFGESDCHPKRNLESSASDMLFLANSLGVSDKFWVVGYSSGSLHAWAALKYIPDRLAGAAMFAPMVSPYDSLMNRGEKYGTWEKWTHKRKFMYFLARRFPKSLSYFYQRSFLSGKHGQIDQWLALTLGRRVSDSEHCELLKDRALIEDPVYEEFWQRDVEESIRQGNAKPFVEEAVLQVSNWGFSLADLKLQKKQQGKGILNLIKLLLGSSEEEYTGFLGPIHIWQGMDDKVVPPSMTDFVHRVLPGAAVHKLPYEGHFTYFSFCDECHRQIFTTLFGTPQGPLNNTIEVEQTPFDDIQVQEEVTQGDLKTD
ncbi:Alpha/beta-Hydrolases superfamily protein [Theobroma cacao]|uniref:Alpha/beta-Hydrolases superfamily protein n=1 Tax=Theobroma cacao TaxID=3641 RepID=A0A061GTC5_THECC|nr:Alpha/beta-Hydrolases superfamily protein [Theobroma cacao]